MALLIEAPIDWRGYSTAGIGLDLRGCSEVIGNEGTQRISIVGGVSDDVADALQARQEGLSLWAIAILSRRRMDSQRQADRIDGSVQLGR